MKNDKDLACIHKEERRRIEAIFEMRSIFAHNKIVKRWEASTARGKKGKRRNVKCKEICNGKEFQLLPICAFGIRREKRVRRLEWLWSERFSLESIHGAIEGVVIYSVGDKLFVERDRLVPEFHTKLGGHGV